MSERNKHFINILFRVVFTSLGAIAEILAVSLIFDIKISMIFLVLVTVLISIIYCWDFYQEYSTQLNKFHRTYTLSAILILIISYAILVSLINNLLIVACFSILLVASLFYDKFFKQITKNVFGFKDVFVAVCWNLLILILFLSSGANSAITIILFLVFVFTRDISNISYCDIKDISADKKNELKTFAEILGINKLVFSLMLISLLSISIIIIGAQFGLFPARAYSLIIPVIITSTLILFSHKTRKYSPTNVDFEYFIWLFFALILRLFI